MKLDLLKDSATGLTFPRLRQRYPSRGILLNERTEHLWNQNRLSMENHVNQDAHATVKSSRAGQFPKLEEAVVKYVQICRQYKLPVTQEVIKVRALHIRDKMLLMDGLACASKKLCGFGKLGHESHSPCWLRVGEAAWGGWFGGSGCHRQRH